MKNHHFLFLGCFCILILFSILSFSRSNGPDQKHDHSEEAEVLPENIVELRDDQAKLAGIETGKIELREINNILKASGFVSASPQNVASVCFPIGGFVKSTSLITGNSVVKGQVLAVLQNQEYVDIQQQYLEARNQFEFAEAEYLRHAELYKEDVYSKENIQKTTVEFKNLKTLLKSLEQKLGIIGISASAINEDNISSEVTVTSPISGYIKSVNINIGKFVTPSDVLFEIVNSDHLLLELTLFEKDADKVNTGQSLVFRVNNELENHHAVIYQTGKSVEKDKTYKVYASVKGSCPRVMPGMFVNADIHTAGGQTSTLPSDAIVSFNDRNYIFVFEKQKTEEGKPFTEYRLVEIGLGASDRGFTEVILPEGFDIQSALVVIKGAYNLLSAKMNAGEMAC